MEWVLVSVKTIGFLEKAQRVGYVHPRGKSRVVSQYRQQGTGRVSEDEGQFEDGGILINPNVRVPRSEVRIRFVRSSGPGGQNVNKVATKAELVFSVDESEAFSEGQKMRLRDKLGRRINTKGELRLSCDEHRSQGRNSAAVIERFANLLRTALQRPKRRVPTRPTRASKERRLTEKKRRGDRKSSRSKPPRMDD